MNDMSAQSFNFPTIFIGKDEKETYRNYINMVEKICNTFERDTAVILEEICKIYNIPLSLDDRKKINNIHAMIFETGAHFINDISSAIKESKELISEIENKREDEMITLDGSRYFFIVRALNFLFYYYTQIIFILRSRKYLDERYIAAIRERLVFLISPEMEEVRKFFKVVECFESMENKITLH